MSEEAIDVKEVLERVQDDKALLLELLDIFEDDYEEKRKAIDQLVINKNLEQLKSIAHSMKGASGNISAKKLHTVFAKLEQMAKESNLTNITQLLADLDKQYSEVKTYMAKLKVDFKQ